MKSSHFCFHIFPSDHGQAMRLDSLLCAQAVLALSRSRIADLIRRGHVRVAGQVCLKPALRLKGLAVLEIDVPPAPNSSLIPEHLPLDILAEDEHLLVVNKPAGMVVHPGPGTATGTLVAALLGYGCRLSSVAGRERPGIVHRLDKGTTGVMVVAKSDAAHLKLIADFAGRRIDKTYLALVMGQVRPRTGTIESRIGRHRFDRKKMSSLTRSGRSAKTSWEVLVNNEQVSLLKITLHTGRTHQIRVHFAEMGYPLLGDRGYGCSSRREAILTQEVRHLLLDPPRPLLHAWRIGLHHPASGQKIRFEAALPRDMGLVLETLHWAMPS